MDPLTTRQRIIYKRILSHFQQFQNKAVEYKTVINAKAKLSRLEEDWAEFVKNHQAIQQLDSFDPTDGYVTSEMDYNARDAFDDNRSMYLGFIKSLTPQEQRPAAVPAPIPQVMQPAQVDLNSLIRSLPPLNVPRFSGDAKDWSNFRDIYQSLIHEGQATNAVKFTYLRSYLEGEPLEIVKAWSITDANYPLAWEALRKFYENERRLVHNYLDDLFTVPPMKSETCSEVRRILNEIFNSVEALHLLGRPTEQWSDIIVYILASKMEVKTRREWEKQLGKTDQTPTLQRAKTFLESQAQMLESVERATRSAKSNVTPSHTPITTKTPLGKPKLVAATTTQPSKPKVNPSESKGSFACPCCGQTHSIHRCDQFKTKSVADRKGIVVSKKLCFNCLGGHLSQSCTSSFTCRTCNGKHHSLLHFDKSSNSPIIPEAQQVHQGDSRGSAPNLQATIGASKNGATALNITDSGTPRPTGVFLSSIMIFVYNKQGEKVLVRALLDQCSQTSFISEALTKRLNLRNKQTNIPISSVGGKKIVNCSKSTIFQIRPHFKSDFTCEVNALIISKVSAYVPPQVFVESPLKHLMNLELADPEFFNDYPVEVLLGSDVHADVVIGEIVRGQKGEPIATSTQLGWVVSGPAPSRRTLTYSNAIVTHHCASKTQLDDQIQRFWVQEEIPSSKNLSPEDEMCEEYFTQTTEIDDSGRCMVRLPFKPDTLYARQNLGDSYRKAVQSLCRLERRFSINAVFEKMYKDFIRDYISSGHMSLIRINSPQRRPIEETYFLPHHGILKPSSTTTKLRTVFNGSSKTTRGFSLNDLLHKGPNLLPELPDLLGNWRVYKFVFASDIRQMFRQIRIHPEDTHFQAIVWRQSPADPIEIYYLNTITYGLVSSPWQATRTLRLIAEQNKDVFPLAHPIILHECYMDDMLSGAHSISDALEKQSQLIGLLKAGGMELRKWLSNHPLIINHLPSEHLAMESDLSFLNSPSFAVLGLHWHAKDDCFSININCTDLPAKLTKRAVLSKIAQVFDPMGWISPVVVTAKIFMQSLWLLKCDWDDVLPLDVLGQWKNWYLTLPALKNVKIPRHIGWSPEIKLCELHGFADASQQAYAAVIYLRMVIDDKVFTSLQMSKTKVAPLQTQSIPRLELCAARTLAELTNYFTKTVRIVVHSVQLWSDSKDVLYWLRSFPARWQTYVANRCREIQTLCPQAHWHYVRSKDNPADIASRGITPDLLVKHELWWFGPKWLKESTSNWPTEADDLGRHLPIEERTLKPSIITSLQTNLACGSSLWELAHKFSSLSKLLRVTAYVLRFIYQFLNKINSINIRNPPLNLSIFGLDFIEPVQEFPSVCVSPVELQNARLYWVYFFQRLSFPRELLLLQVEGHKSRIKGPLAKLDPFVSRGLIHVGGRLNQALLDFDQKHPLILPGNCFFTKLIIRDVHLSTLHGGTQLTLGTIRRQYWVLNGRNAVKAIIGACVPCVRFSSQKYNQLMGQLPRVRISPNFPFLKTGIDYAGPVLVRLTKARGKGTLKGYICLFVCMVTRAIHLELVEDGSSEAFIGAFKRFTSRRGWCSDLYSDNGRNFQGADRELREMFTESSDFFRRINIEISNQYTTWHWNPPSAPHFGGIWEAGVKSTKHHLKRVIGEQILTFSELTTLLCQIEACLNSRPLLPLTSDPTENEFLSPSHFLIQRPSFIVPERDYTNERIPIGRRWQHITKQAQTFWNRWKDEVLPTLQPRQKWLSKKRSFQVGDVVYIRSENTPPGQWPLGRIVKDNPDRHGISRYYTVRVGKTAYERPGVKLVLVVPIDQEPPQETR